MILPGEATSVPGGSALDINVILQRNFQIHYLCIPEMYAVDFRIRSLHVGKISIFASLSSVPALLFSMINLNDLEKSEMSAPVKNMWLQAMRLDAPMGLPGHFVCLRVENTNASQRRIEFAYLGEEIDSWSPVVSQVPIIDRKTEANVVQAAVQKRPCYGCGILVPTEQSLCKRCSSS